MQQLILQSTEKILTLPGVLGVVICRHDTIFFQKIDPPLELEQLQHFGRAVHELFSGYLNVQRQVSEISLLFKHGCLNAVMRQEKGEPFYLITLAKSLDSLSLAAEETRLWPTNDLFKKAKGTSRITSKLRPTAHLQWGRFLARIRECLDLSISAESASVVLTRSLGSFQLNSSDPLPSEQWLAFVAEVGNQIPNPDARARFYKIYSEMDNPEAKR
jgi:hypothetical protein